MRAEPEAERGAPKEPDGKRQREQQVAWAGQEASQQQEIGSKRPAHGHRRGADFDPNSVAKSAFNVLRPATIVRPQWIRFVGASSQRASAP